MIILPVEKRLNWNRAPIVLFAIVILNILIYFFYQLNDDEKYINALDVYTEQNLHQIEPKLYDDYLQLPKNSAQLELMQENTDYQDSYEDLIYSEYGADEQDVYITLLLQDESFYEYLKVRPSKFDSKQDYQDWLNRRDQVNTWLNKMSSTQFALVPAEKDWFSYISHQFMHGDLMHLFGNLFFLIMCGFAVEAAIGHFRFLLFYLLAGIAGGIGHTLSDPESVMPLVGASGAISGVMAMYMGIFRLKKIEFFYWFYIFVGYVRAPALFILVLYIGKELFEYFTMEGSNVAYMAHIGGFVGGILLIFGVLLFNRDMLDDEYIEEDDSIDPSQVQHADILNAIEKLQYSKAFKLLDQQIAKEDDEERLHEYLMLKANLLFLTKNSQADDFTMQVLSNYKALEYQLDDYETLWKKVTQKLQTNPEARLKAGIQFCRLPDIRLAESIFDSLLKQKFRDGRMSVFAGRIAHYHQKKNNMDKSAHYQKLMQYFEQHV